MPFTVEYFIIRHTHPNVLLPIRNNNLLFFYEEHVWGKEAKGLNILYMYTISQIG